MEKNKMLVDATHPEETRVVVLRGGRVEEFDYESAARKPLRGNIYLAKVTRVEPSLQAAFVEYGGNRHGFLAFSEIHPDYYQIPFADRQALLDEEAEEEARAEQEADARAERRARRDRGGRRRHGAGRSDEMNGETAEPETVETDGASHVEDAPETVDAAPDQPSAVPASHHQDADMRLSEAPERIEPVTEIEPAPFSAQAEAQEPVAERATEAPATDEATDVDDVPAPIGLVEDVGVSEVEENGSADGATPEQIEQVGAEDALEEVPERPRRRARQYKIQEVIKRRQIILIQVVKEERGNKGAALTTYLSLAGRYTVLMPNTGRGGGISRKITQPQDRKRLKAIAQELEVPEGMGLIIRTAGAARTKQEIKRDFEYLLRLWESVRDMTLRSTAPCLVYEEGNLIKRSLRDLYSKDIDEVLVAGDGAYQEAHDFMRMLMPSHADNVISYDDPEPLFTRFQIERQLNAMFSPYVTLRSGGYLVINQTEALVSVDVNSGKSTREFSIEETALNTNLEAADEIARQLKLRDLAGLIVIDFIDMEEKRNNRAVERRLKDALRFDRARIQVGHISHFGLLEMSRQRLRTGVLEGSTSQCPHCQGTGIIRSTESVALAVIRAIEDHLMKGQPTSLTAITTTSVALYILNQKRAFINEIERRHDIVVTVQASDRMQGASFAIERSAEAASAPRRVDRGAAVSMDWGFDGDDEAADEAPPAAVEHEEESAGESRQREGSRSRRRRRGRGRRGERGEGGSHREEATHRHHHEHAQPEREPEDEGAEPQFLAVSEPYGGDDGDESEAGSEVRTGEPSGERPVEDGENGDGRNRNRRRRRGRRGGRSRGRGREEGGEVSASGEAYSPPLPGDEQPDVAPGYVPHVAWDDYPQQPRREEAPRSGSEQPDIERQVATDHGTFEVRAEPYAPPAPESEDRKAEPMGSSAGIVEAERPKAEEAPPSEPEPAQASSAGTSNESAVPTTSHEPVEAPSEPVTAEPAQAAEPPKEEPSGPPRKGWWQRRFGSG